MNTPAPRNDAAPPGNRTASTGADSSATYASAHEAARSYVGRGWSVIPVPHGRKNPTIRGWPDLRLTNDDLLKHFDGQAKNVGVLLGEPSGNLIDLDLDRPEAVAVAGRIALPTDSIFGRASNQRSHRIYACTDRAPKTRKFNDPTDGEAICELRSTGAQTIFPPSTHPSGELAAWDSDGQPGVVTAQKAQKSTALIASAALLGTHWPNKGSRHQAALSLAGGLLRAGWSVEDVKRFIEAVCVAVGDEETADRIRAAKTTDLRLRANDEATGWPTLAKIIGQPVAGRIREWLGVGQADNNSGGLGGCPSQDGEALDWADPLPLVEPDPPAFPVEVIRPQAASEYVKAVGTAYGVPVDLVGLAWLALAGGCLTWAGSRRRIVRINPDWVEPLNLYVAVALPSGTRKSAVFSVLTAPVLAFEQRLAKCALRQGAKAPQLICDDVTPEKLTSLLTDHDGKMILASAECDLIGVLKGRYTDKGGPNLSVFLKAHNGDLLRVDRVGRPGEHVDSPALTMLMCCQTDALASMLRDRVLCDRGVTNRFLYAVPASPLGSRPLDPRNVPANVKAQYSEMMRRALEWHDHPPHPPQSKRDHEPRWVRLNTTAKRVLDDLRAEVEKSMGPGDDFETHSGWASKLPGAVCRIAGIMTLMEIPDSKVIKKEAMASAVEIGRWAIEHAKIAFRMVGIDPDVKRAQRLLGWLERSRVRQFTKREACQALKGSTGTLFHRASDLDEAIRILVDHGWITPLDAWEREHGRPGRNPSPSYAVHPTVEFMPGTSRRGLAQAVCPTRGRQQ